MAKPRSYSREQIAAEKYAEETQLRKADADIATGRLRLHNQERLIETLKASEQTTGEAERLAVLLRGVLTEWERHRSLIVQRLAYLGDRLGDATREP